MAAEYAPDITFSATAVLAPAVDLHGIFSSILDSDKPITRTILALIVARAWIDTYPGQSLDDILTLQGRTVVETAVDHFCIPWVGVPALLYEPSALINSDALDTWANLITENTPGDQPEQPPIFIGQGDADDVIPIAGSEHYAEDLCAAGNSVQLHTYPGATHFTVVPAATQDVVDFFAAVRAGKAPATSCSGSLASNANVNLGST
jgi:acetyl esterase/lipase